jgi:hypothetical protein
VQQAKLINIPMYAAGAFEALWFLSKHIVVDYISKLVVNPFPHEAFTNYNLEIPCTQALGSKL